MTYIKIFEIVSILAVVACLFEIKIILGDMLDFFIEKGEECNGDKNCREE